MHPSALAQQLRVFAITILGGSAVSALAALVIHYGLSAAATQAENQELKAQVGLLVERLADVESILQHVNEQREGLDSMTLQAVHAVLGTTEIDPEREGKVYLATLPAGPRLAPKNAGPAAQPVATTLAVTDAVGRIEAVKQQAVLLMRDMQATDQAVALRQDVLNAIPSRMPAKGWISSGYGPRQSPFDGTPGRMHLGIDVAADEGTPVYATADGVVGFAGKFGGYGNYVRLNHGFGIQTRYAHNARLLVKKGDKVHRGDQIAVIGSTGRSTGPHVHYEVLVHEHPIDPARFFFDSKPAEAQPALSLAVALRPMGGELETADQTDASALAETAPEEPGARSGIFGLLAGETLVFAASLPAPLRHSTTSDVMMLAAVLLMLTVASSLVRMPEMHHAAGVIERDAAEAGSSPRRFFLVGRRFNVWAGSATQNDGDDDEDESSAA